LPAFSQQAGPAFGQPPGYGPPPVFGQQPAFGQQVGGPPAFSSGAFTMLILASLLCSGLVGLIVGGVNLKHPARNAQAKNLLIAGAVGIVLGVILIAAAQSGSNSNF
jgi:uncharacterized membrane protein HdeD (DUF308 family)